MRTVQKKSNQKFHIMLHWRKYFAAKKVDVKIALRISDMLDIKRHLKIIFGKSHIKFSSHMS
jgi:hypothetical protein